MLLNWKFIGDEKALVGLKSNRNNPRGGFAYVELVDRPLPK